MLRISGVTGEGVERLIDAMAEAVGTARAEEARADEARAEAARNEHDDDARIDTR